MRKSNYLTAILFIFVISFFMISLLVNGQASSWNKVPSPTNADLESVDMVSPTDGWAVGEDGTIIHWDGTSWRNVTSPTSARLVSLDMVSSNEGYAIVSGSVSPLNESVIRWDGTNWKNVTTIRGYFNSVDMISSTEGWAVGNGGNIMRWDGTSWSNVESPTSAWLKSVDTVDSTEAWIVGVDGNIYRWQQAQDETSNIPFEYILIIGAAVVAVLVVWFFLRKRS